MRLKLKTKHFLLVQSGLMFSFFGAQTWSQSTGTRIEEGELEEVVVAAQRAQVSGLMRAEEAPKSRSTVSQEYITTQMAGQSVIQSLNLVPGVNFTNSDAYGSSGGNLRMRSYDGNRISLMLDGVPLNDTGNYAIYTNQQVDPEIIEQASVNLGTTDVDSPTASATGGTINLVMVKPADKFSAMIQPSVGSFDYRRIFGRVDSGSFGPWNTSSLLAASVQQYDKFKGPGELKRTQINARLYQDLGNDNFVSLAVHWNRNRNPFYRNLSLANIAQYGWRYDYDPTCSRLAPGGGTQDESATAVTCTNYYGLRINPSDTGNIRAQSSFALSDSLRLTIDPSFQYVLANGGGFTALSETDARLRGATAAAGKDLNGDGDTADTIAVYSPNNTNTHRYEVNSSLLWTLMDGQVLRFGYTLDYGKHRQTGQYGFLDGSGNPENVFAGRNGRTVTSVDGFDIRGRDRYTLAKLNQVSVSYSSRLWEDRVRLNVGVRAPFFRRSLNQYCYTQISNGNQYCTSQTPNAPNAAGYVTFGTSSATYLRPYSGQKKYDKVLPNAGISVRPWSNESEFYLSYAAGFSAPRTDNLYNVQILNVQPETTQSIDLGYRYQGSSVLGSAVLWRSHYKNRIVTAFDPDVGLSVDRNVGTVNLYGFDSSLGARLFDHLTLYGTASYNHSRVENDIPYSGTVFVPTAGKELVETPRWTVGGRAEYEIAAFSIGLQGKYVAKRWATDANDEYAPAYVVYDADARWAFGSNSYLQFNVLNILDRDYLGSVATSRFSADVTKPYGTSAPLYAIGAPRTFQVSVRVGF